MTILEMGNKITEISVENMTHEQWLEERRKGIGGSDAGAIVGLNKYSNALDVYLDKIGQGKERDSEAMRIGRDLEPYVVSRFEEATGKSVIKRSAMFTNSEYPFAFADVDGLIDGENAGLECKTTRRLSSDGDYPDEWYVQCQHYMAVTGRDKWYLAILNVGRDPSFNVEEINRNDDDIQALMNTEMSFWENNVLKKEMPAPTGTDRNDETLSELFPVGNDEETASLDGFEESLSRLSDIKMLVKSLEDEKKEIEQKIKAQMKTAVYAETDRFKVKWSNTSRRTVDYDALEADGLNKYIISKPSRRLTITERKEVE